jgi:hypothetical protein
MANCSSSALRWASRPSPSTWPRTATRPVRGGARSCAIICPHCSHGFVRGPDHRLYPTLRFGHCPAGSARAYLDQCGGPPDGGIVIALSVPAMAQDTPARVTPDALAWKESPAFPKGVHIATLVGDPTKSGDVVVMRIKFPANLQMPPHTHPYSEVVTIVSGKVGTSHGESSRRTAIYCNRARCGCIRLSTPTTPGLEMRRA